MNFNNIIGHYDLKNKLQEIVKSDRTPHAILLEGQNSGYGALPLALSLSNLILCETPTDNGMACGECSSCYQMQRFEHPDCHLIFPVNTSKLAASIGRSDSKAISDMFVHLFRELCIDTNGYFSEQELYTKIGIENSQGNINKSEASELLRKMSFKSFRGGYKCVVMWLPERLHDTAANSLLKLIEEPSENTIFIFVTNDSSRVLGTILSRCQRVTVPAIAEIDLEQALTAKGLDSKLAQETAKISQGDWIKALSLAQLSSDSDDARNRHIDSFIALMRLCYSNKFTELFSWADTMVGIGRESQRMFCRVSLDVIRSSYMYNIGMEDLSYIDPKYQEFCKKFSPFINHKSIEAMIAEFESLSNQIKQNGNPKILFPHFALTLCKIIVA